MITWLNMEWRVNNKSTSLFLSVLLLSINPYHQVTSYTSWFHSYCDNEMLKLIVNTRTKVWETEVNLRQRTWRIHFQSGFFGSFDAPWSERSWIDLFRKETQNPFKDSIGFKNPILDFFRRNAPLVNYYFQVSFKIQSVLFWFTY